MPGWEGRYFLPSKECWTAREGGHNKQCHPAGHTTIPQPVTSRRSAVAVPTSSSQHAPTAWLTTSITGLQLKRGLPRPSSSCVGLVCACDCVGCPTVALQLPGRPNAPIKYSCCCRQLHWQSEPDTGDWKTSPHTDHLPLDAMLGNKQHGVASKIQWVAHSPQKARLVGRTWRAAAAHGAQEQRAQVDLPPGAWGLYQGSMPLVGFETIATALPPPLRAPLLLHTFVLLECGGGQVCAPAAASQARVLTCKASRALERKRSSAVTSCSCRRAQGVVWRVVETCSAVQETCRCRYASWRTHTIIPPQTCGGTVSPTELVRGLFARGAKFTCHRCQVANRPGSAWRGALPASAWAEAAAWQHPQVRGQLTCCCGSTSEPQPGEGLAPCCLSETL